MMADTNWDVFDRANFLRPVEYKTEFTPSTTGWTAVTDITYAGLRTDIGIANEIPIEAFRYYTSCLYWLRVIGLKSKQGQELTRNEFTVFQIFSKKTFTIPVPIFFGLEAIGQITTPVGDTLVPTFPELPVTVVQNIPGTLGLASVENHNIYEELPVIGIAYQGCYERAQTVNKHVYASVVAPSGTIASRNLQGFDSLNETWKDALRILYCMGFKTGQFPSTVVNSGIYFNMLETISNVLKKTKAFKLYMVSPLDIEVNGSVAQVIEAKPYNLEAGMLASNTTVRSQSLMFVKGSLIGESQFYGLNQFKSNLESQNLAEAITPWSCITFSAENPPPENWSEQRNQRRNLPEVYHDCRFQCCEENLADCRKAVMDRFSNKIS